MAVHRGTLLLALLGLWDATTAFHSVTVLQHRRSCGSTRVLPFYATAKLKGDEASSLDAGDERYFIDKAKRGRGQGGMDEVVDGAARDGASPIPVGLEDIVRNLHERTWSSLDLHVVQERLASYADTVAGQRLALSPCLAESVEEVEQRYKAVEEVWASPEPIPINHAMDIEGVVRFAARGNVLEVPQLREVAKTLAVLSTLKLFLDSQSGMVQLKAYADGIVLPPELLDLLTDAFDDEGKLSGTKFPQLRRLRDGISGLYGSIRTTVNDLMKSNSITDMLTDEYVAQRNGRFVIPVKNTYKRSGLGIVHDQSNTGKTVYIEPVQVIEQTNDLKRLELELQQEEVRIMTEMTRVVAVSKEEILSSLDAAALIDVSVARAQLGDTLQGIIPKVGRDGVVAAKDARHPVLVLRGREPVGNSMHIDGKTPGLVLTGPNAGGKTIVLKTLGLLALLVRLGVPVPCQRGARVDFFSPILADIGDMQSVTGDLSTFSGHLLVCREVLDNAGSGALVLMDEMGSGTDPAQGVAIAQALLEALVSAGARVAITTHYVQLKELAQCDQRFTVGAMEFLNGKPTYRFREGAIGESYALEVAERLELPKEVMQRARSLMDENVLKVTALVKELEAQRDQLQGDILAAQKREEELRVEKAQLERQMEELQDKQIELDRIKYRAKLETAEAFMKRLEEKEKNLETLLRNAGIKERATVEEALQELRAVKAEVEEESKPEVVHVPSNLNLLKKDDVLKEGEIVMVSGDELNSGRTGKVVRVSGQNVDVMFSRVGIDVVVSFKKTELARAPEEVVSELTSKSKPKKEKKKWTKADERNLKLLGEESKGRRDSVGASPGSSDKPFRMASNTVDVRGLRLRDAEVKIDSFLKQCFVQGRKYVFILHGHGTGQLKEGLREYLKTNSYVTKSQPAEEVDGGDAFTLATLRKK